MKRLNDGIILSLALNARLGMQVSGREYSFLLYVFHYHFTK